MLRVGGVVLGTALLVYIILSNFDKIMYLKMTVLERHYSKQGVRTTSMGHNTTRDSMNRPRTTLSYSDQIDDVSLLLPLLSLSLFQDLVCLEVAFNDALESLFLTS